MALILAATDFSIRSQHAVRRAARLAAQFQSDLVLAHVVDDDQPEHLISAADRGAQSELDSLVGDIFASSDVRARWTIAHGDPFAGIIRLAEETKADLVVLGAHRKQLLKDVFVGTTVERVLRANVAPVLVVGREPKGPYLGVVVAVDFSNASTRALKTASRLGLLGGHVTVLHVYDAFGKGMLQRADIPASQIETYVARGAVEAAQELAAFLGTLDLQRFVDRMRVRAAESRVSDAITAMARDAYSDLVAIGTNSRKGLARFFLGSVAMELLEQLDNAVLVVPAAIA